MSNPRTVIQISTPLILSEMRALYQLSGMAISHGPLPLASAVLLRIPTGSHDIQMSLTATVIANENGVVRVACRNRQQVVAELLRCRRLDDAVAENDDETQRLRVLNRSSP